MLYSFFLLFPLSHLFLAHASSPAETRASDLERQQKVAVASLGGGGTPRIRPWKGWHQT